MVAAAEKAHRRLMINMSLRFQGEAFAMRELLDDGRLGEVYYGHAEFTKRSSLPAAAFRKDATSGRGPWFVTRKLSGGGAEMDLGVHVLDLAWWLMGNPKPASVFASAFQRLSPEILAENGVESDVPEMVTMQIAFENGAALHVSAAWVLHMRNGMFLNLSGTEAGVSSPPVTLYRGKMDGQIDEEIAPVDAPAAQQHFIDCIRDPERPMVASGAECLSVARMLAAAQRSVKTGATAPVK